MDSNKPTCHTLLYCYSFFLNRTYSTFFIIAVAVTPPDVPPPPPLNTSYGHSMNNVCLNTSTDGSYMNPNIRGDMVPGDVRSPLPNAQMFKYAVLDLSKYVLP